MPQAFSIVLIAPHPPEQARASSRMGGQNRVNQKIKRPRVTDFSLWKGPLRVTKTRHPRGEAPVARDAPRTPRRPRRPRHRAPSLPCALPLAAACAAVCAACALLRDTHAPASPPLLLSSRRSRQRQRAADAALRPGGVCMSTRTLWRVTHGSQERDMVAGVRVRGGGLLVLQAGQLCLRLGDPARP